MTKLKAGDRVDCRIKSTTIVSAYNEYDEVRTFEVVARDAHGYYLYVPHYIVLKESVIADKYRCNTLNIDYKFLDEHIIYISQSQIYKVSKIMDGMKCCNCQEFYDMAEPNQDDGTLICYACRFNPWR